MTVLNRRSLFASGAGLAALTLSACGAGGRSTDGPTADGDGVTTIKIAASPQPHAEILAFISENLAEDAGLTLEVEEQTDYKIPNRLLNDGEVDANFFQHVPYLETEMEESGYDLSPFEGVHIEPLGAYADSITSLDELADGDEVGIPNDPTNRGRALALLADNGVITLADGIEPTDATPDDIAENPKNLQFPEIDAALLPRTLSDYAAAVVNGNFALEAGLSPADDSIVLEKAEGNPYANVLVVRSADTENEALVALDELLHSDEVRQYIEDTYDAAIIPAF